MSPANPFMKPHTASGVGQLIARFLERLAACLLRLEASGETLAPADLTNWVVSADALVHGYVRMHTAEQLTRAGYFEAARAMRTYGVCSREPAFHIEHAQGCTSVTPADLLARLETIISNFQRAEHIASVLARMIVWVLSYLTPETRERRAYTLSVGPIRRVGVRPPKTIPVGRGPPYIWHLPFPQIPVKTGIHTSGFSSGLSSEVWPFDGQSIHWIDWLPVSLFASVVGR